MLTSIFYVFATVVAIQFFYYVILFGRFSFSKPKNQVVNNQPVSVIICAKNESENLKEKLELFANQQYAKFELVLINDRSTDDTLDIMEAFKETYEERLKFRNITVKIVNIQENEQFWGSKKYALTLGIKAATNELLLFTDADCEPVSPLWIQEMVAGFSDDKSIILGYGGYRFIKNSLLNKIIRFETLMTAIQYFSYAKMGMPYMGVGRNLAYTKTQFFASKGFANHMHLRSGDDDLFINQIAHKKNTTVCYTPNSFTISEPKTSFNDWFLQKRRHISTAGYYKFHHQLLLGLFYFSQILFWILATILLIFQFQLYWILGIIGFRFFFTYLIIGLSAKKLKEKNLVFFNPILELFLILSQFVFYIQNLISKPKHW
ncbi:MAG: glycosyltransferase [Flavobacteriaceae bacterium]|nr:glycosyltransferase [Flavobacteriaceae bacterium]